MADFLNLFNQIVDFIKTCKLEGIFKISILVLTFAFLWPIGQNYLKIYDITVINRLNESCDFSTLASWSGSVNVEGSMEHPIAPSHAHHYQVVPSWTGLYGSFTRHIRLKLESRKSVVIPIYNSGDIQRSRLFFIEQSGVREQSTDNVDAWNWCECHMFGQQGH